MPRQFGKRDLMVGVVATAATLAVSSSAGFASSHKTHEVKIKSFEFEPQTISAKAGDIIRWTNEDIVPHTATADASGWDTGEIKNGGSGEVKVVEDMELSYFCVFHPHMKGTIELKENG